MNEAIQWGIQKRGDLAKALIFILILVFYGSLLLYQIELPAGDDVPRHIKNGEMILKGNFDVLSKNVYSYSEPDHPFVNHHWFSGVVFYIVHSVLGWSGLVTLKVFVLLAAFTLLFLTALKKANFWVVSFFSIPTTLLFIERSTVRPEIFSYLFIAIFLYMLIGSEKHPERNKIFWLVPLQLLWVNMHVFWSIGIMIVLGFLLERIILHYKNIKTDVFIKKLTLLFVLLPFISFINPNGIRGVLYHYPEQFPLNISENTPLLDFKASLVAGSNVSVELFVPLAGLLAFSFLFFGFKQKEKPIFYFLGSIATAMLGFLILRGVALFGFMFLPAISTNCTPIFNRAKEFIDKKTPYLSKAIKILFSALFSLIILGAMFLGGQEKFLPYRKEGIGLSPNSLGSAQFFKEHNLQGPIFNNADIGSYLVYELYPQEKVFVDNRFGDAYSAAFFSETYLSILAKEEVWQRELTRYNFNTIFFNPYDESPNIRAFLQRRARDPAWALVYADMYAEIFVRNTSENRDIIEKFRITAENSSEALKYLTQSSRFDDQVAAADLFILLNREDLGKEMFKKIVARWPHKGKIWMIMGELELTETSMENSVLARMYLERAIQEGYNSAEAYTFLGLAHARTGDLVSAEKDLIKALKINPKRRDAETLLQAVREHAGQT